MPNPDWCVPQSRQTPDLGTPASQLTAVGHTQDCPATGTAAVILHHFLDAKNDFLNREEHPSHSYGLAAQSPQHQCIIPMQQLTSALVTVLPRHLASTTTAQITMILNGGGLSQPPPFLPRMTCALLSSHLNTLTPHMTHRLLTYGFLTMDAITVHRGPCRIQLC